MSGEEEVKFSKIQVSAEEEINFLKLQLYEAGLKIQELTFKIRYGEYERAKNIVEAYEKGLNIGNNE